jgi:hypothetical protein
LREVERWLSPNLNYDPDKVTRPPSAGCSCGKPHANG